MAIDRAIDPPLIPALIRALIPEFIPEFMLAFCPWFCPEICSDLIASLPKSGRMTSPLNYTLALSLLVPTASWADQKTVQLSVPGMNCASCPYLAKRVTLTVDVVLSVSANLVARCTTVVYDDAKATAEAVRPATESIPNSSIIVASGG